MTINPLQFIGAIAIAFGVLVILFPDLVGYLVGIFFVIIGVNILMFGNRFNQRLK